MLIVTDGGRCGKWCPTDDWDDRRFLSLLQTAPASLRGLRQRNYDEPPVLCEQRQVELQRDFFDNVHESEKWNYRGRMHDGTGTQLNGGFLGPFYDGEEPHTRIDNIPEDCDEISIQFTIIELDDWSK